MAEYYESKICGKIEKLNQLNYHRWVTRIRHHFTATQCLPIVLGDEPCPPPGNTTQSKKLHRTWIENDGRAMGTLLGACTQDIAIHIESSTSSADMWRILAGIANSADTETGRGLLFREFVDIKAIPGEPLSNFFGRLQETVGLLAGTDHHISPYHHRTQLLRNLPKEYDVIRTIIEEKSPEPTIQQIIETLKRTEKEIDDKKKVISSNTTATSETALYAGQRASGRGSYRGGGRFTNQRSSPYVIAGKCYNCGREGHRARDCPSKTLSTNHSTPIDNKICFNCGEDGHYTDGCPHDLVTREQSRKGRSAYLSWAKQKDARLAGSAHMANQDDSAPL